MKKVKVALGSKSYEIHIAAGLLARVGASLKETGFGGKVVIITNPTLKRLYGDLLTQSLDQDGFRVATLEVPEGEEQKSLETAGRLYGELSRRFTERTTPILALGGGVIGDLAGFVAATYMRGVPLIHIPTTLLAQVDSSIGGKVAVNHGQLKNMVGAFYQPRRVISDIATLKTLPPKEFANGLAEVIKSAVIRDGAFFAFIEANLAKIRGLNEAVLEEVVFRSASIKAEVVARDELDLDLRNILNFGHTIGHAIETVSDFKIEHGGGVAIGMVAAATISKRMGILDNSEFKRLKGVIKELGLPTEIAGHKAPEIIQAMKHDKKIAAGRIRFILPRRMGEAFLSDEVDLSLVEQVLTGQQ